MRSSVLLVIAAWTALTTGCDFSLLGTCDDEVRNEVTSPGGRYVATVFERDCGATTDFSTLVSLRSVGEEFDPVSQGVVLSTSGRHDLGLAWTSEDHLTIDSAGAERFTQETTWRGVTIAYK